VLLFSLFVLFYLLVTLQSGDRAIPEPVWHDRSRAAILGGGCSAYLYVKRKKEEPPYRNYRDGREVNL
jgi:hypothetical protein